MKTANEIMTAMQAVVDLAEAETRSMTEEEVQTYEALETELKSVNKTEELFARQAAYRSPIVGFPAVIKAAPKGDEALEYAFTNYLRTGQVNQDIAQLYAQTVGSDAAGGYTVPSGFRQKLVEQQVAYGGLRNLAETISTGDGRPLEWPTNADQGGSVARADIAAEGAASATGADVAFGTLTIGAFKYTASGAGASPVKVSHELLQDSAFDVGGFVAKILGQRIARKIDYDIMNGSGTGAPQGLMYGTGGTIEADIISATGTYVALNNLVHALDPAYRQGASWIMNDTSMKMIENVVDSSGRSLLLPATTGYNVAQSVGTLLGYPVHLDQAAPTIDTNDVIGIAFGRWNEAYLCRDVKDIQVLVNPYAAAGYITYDAWARFDGRIQNTWAYVTGEGV
jgi:HK97 family phage major capsid protein